MEAAIGKIIRKCIFSMKNQLIFCKTSNCADSDDYTALWAAHNCSQKEDIFVFKSQEEYLNNRSTSDIEDCSLTLTVTIFRCCAFRIVFISLREVMGKPSFSFSIFSRFRATISSAKDENITQLIIHINRCSLTDLIFNYLCCFALKTNSLLVKKYIKFYSLLKNAKW